MFECEDIIRLCGFSNYSKKNADYQENPDTYTLKVDKII